MNKKIAAFLLSVMIILIFSVPVLAFSEDSNPVMDQDYQSCSIVSAIGLEFAQNIYRANNIGQSILEAIYNNSSTNRSMDPSESFSYPCYFGGLYIDSDGNLVILIAESFATRGESVNTLSFASRSEGASIRYVEHSKNDLLTMQEYIIYLVFSTPNEIADNLVRVSIDAMANRVVVGLSDYSERLISLFKEIIVDSPMVTFEEAIRFEAGMSRTNDYRTSDDLIEDYLSNVDPFWIPGPNSILHPGQRIHSPFDFGTLGFRASCRQTGARGYITAAHVTGPWTGTTVHGNLPHPIWTPFSGTVNRALLNGIDAAFVSGNNLNISNRVNDVIEVNTFVPRPIQFNFVQSFGATTKQFVLGRIERANVVEFMSSQWGILRIDEATIASFSSALGDSGAPVFTASTMFPQPIQPRNPLGIVVAGGFNVSLISNLNPILNTLDLWLTSN